MAFESLNCQFISMTQYHLHLPSTVTLIWTSYNTMYFTALFFSVLYQRIVVLLVYNAALFANADRSFKGKVYTVK